MWRSFFLAIGLTLCILGGECLIVDKAFLKPPDRVVQPKSLYNKSWFFTPTARREFVPPEWAPWSLLSAGAVISLYALTVARNG